MNRMNRQLSGIFFRQKNNETGKFENVCFEDLRPEERDRVMKDRDAEWLKSLAIQLADTLQRIGDQLDIVSWEKPDEDPTA